MNMFWNNEVLNKWAKDTEQKTLEALLSKGLITQSEYDKRAKQCK